MICTITGKFYFFPVNVYSFGINNFQKVKIFRSILIFLNYSCHFHHFLLNFASHSSENCVLLPPPHLSLAMETTFPFALIYNWKREIIENGISPGFFFQSIEHITGHRSISSKTSRDLFLVIHLSTS